MIYLKWVFGALIAIIVFESEDMENSSPLLNPWISMWTQPRATIHQIIQTDPERMVLMLAALAGVAQALDRASMKNAGDIMSLPAIMILAAIAGPIGGVIGLYIGGALLRWTGNWIGGRASSRNIRTAIAWSSVPSIWALILWVPELALFGKEIFTKETPRIDANPSLALLLIIFALVEITIGIWAFIVFLKSLGQVQGFSAWKALGNLILSGLIIVVPVAIVVAAMIAMVK